MSATAWSDACFAALKPRPTLSVSEWADRHRVIPAGTSPEAGRWRTPRTPYIREPLDSISDPAVGSVAMQWASQLGKTEIILNAIGYYCDQDPAAILLVEPTETMAGTFSKERIEPMFRASPALRGKISDKLKDKQSTTLLKSFPGGYLAMAWATSSVSLASRPIRILLGDEIDKWPESTGRDGDPFVQAVQRTQNFYNRKIVVVSTPDIEATSRIVHLYEESDQRRLWLPCARCGAEQILEWVNVIYKGADGEVNLDDVHYRCEHCKGRIEQHERPAMLDAGRWIAENPGARTDDGREARGYQLSALYSPWVKWAELAAQWVKATRDRDRKGLMEFVQLRLGEGWVEDGDKVRAENLEANREDYAAEVPLGVLLLTAGVDTQDNRLEVEIVGWGLGKQSWGIHYAIIPGDTNDAGPNGPWAKLDALLARPWTRADGSGLVLQCVCIDSRGHRVDVVYQWCRDRTTRNIFAVYGVDGSDKPIAGKPTLTKFKSSKYPVGVDTAKATLYGRLKLPRLDGPEQNPGYCHFPRSAPPGLPFGYDTEYFKGLVSEEWRKISKQRGKRVMGWVQVHSRNEPLDCRNYATAAMELLCPDFAALAGAVAAPPPSSGQTRGRRMLNRGIGA